MAQHIPLLIIGAGPFGLAISAYARHDNIEHVIVGKPMGFWISNMPAGMYLRSGCDWHYDPHDEDTIERWLETQRLKPEDVEPLSRDYYLGYCKWFQAQKGIEVLPSWIERLDYHNAGSPFFEAIAQDGKTITARNVVLAPGFGYFKNIPDPYPDLFPSGRFVHTCDLVDFEPLKGKRLLIIGGRQSAFEWAAMISDHDADRVYLSYRHETPAFEQADWSWVNPLVDAMATNPGWFRRLTTEEKDQVNRRLWAEGRLKLEPWLAKRIAKDKIKLLPNSQVTACRESPGGELEVRVNGTTIEVDQVIMATGYKVDVSQIPLLGDGNILARLETRNGYPALDEHFQSSVPGLFFTSMCAAQDFGPFMGFTVAVRTSAKLIGSAVQA